MKCLFFLGRTNIQTFLKYENEKFKCFGFVANMPDSLLEINNIPINESITSIDHKQIKGFFFIIK